jgi:RNA 2',3'-cyclic 3'-phosphodiesterase
MYVVMTTSSTISLRTKNHTRRSHSLAQRTTSNDHLFLAFFPDRYAATHIADVAKSKCSKHGLRGNPLAETRFHLSLHQLAPFGQLMENFVRNVGIAVDGVVGAVPPFEITFDRVCRFSGSGAFVLWNPGGNGTLLQFRDTLGVALRSCGVPCDQSKFQPHVTLLYDDQAVVEEVVEPVSWVVNEVVLVRSIFGKTKYELLERWKLRG